jgi:hypothetical protein
MEQYLAHDIVVNPFTLRRMQEDSCRRELEYGVLRGASEAASRQVTHLMAISGIPRERLDTDAYPPDQARCRSCR